MRTYEELIKILPKETVEFIDTVVPYLDYYCRKNIDMSFTGITIDNFKNKVFYLCLCAGCKNKETEAILSRLGFDKEIFKYCISKVNRDNASISELFLKNNYFFPEYNDEIKYGSLLPLDIIYHNITNDLLYYDYDARIYYKILPNAPQSMGNLKKTMKKYLDQEKEKFLNDITTNLYDNNVPISVISLLNTASIIRSIIYELDFDKINLKINRNDTDIVPLSILMAISYYTDTEKIYADITYQKLIMNYFNNQNINNLTDTLKLDLKKEQPDYVAIKKYYLRYIKEGIFNSENKVPITIPNVLTNLFNREFTNSYIIDEVFAQNGKNIDDFKNIHVWINNELNKYKLEHETKIKDKLYADISKETIDFINFIGKTYQVLQTKLKINNDLIKSKNDIATLSLLIASMYYETKVGLYYIEHNITLDKIFDLFKINITKEEIENEKIDLNILGNDLYDLIYNGFNINVTNGGKSARINLNKNYISNNLTKNDITKSNIMENIFYIFNNEYIDRDTFLDDINDYFELKEQEIKRKKEKERKKLEIEFFKDMPKDTIKVLKNIVASYNTLVYYYRYNKEDIKLFAILIGVLHDSENIKVKYFIDNAFNITNITNYLEIIKLGFNFTDKDINTLKNEFSPYIFEGFNKDLKPKDITAYDILKNVFNQDLYKSEALENFLHSINKSYDDFIDLEDCYKKYVEVENLQKKAEEVMPIISRHNILEGDFFKNVACTWEIINEKLTKKELDSKYLKNEDDIAAFSLLFWYLKDNKPLSTFLNKYNITLENLLLSCNLKVKDIIKNKIAMDYYLIYNCLHRFLDIAKDEEITSYADDFIKKLFNPEINPSTLIKDLINNDAEYQKLKIEIETGKDYLYSLSVDDRISLLKNTPMDTINLDDIKSIMLYGESLRVHSSYLHDEIPNLIKNSTINMSLTNINNLINKVYSPKQVEKPKKFFTWLFDGGNSKAQLAIDTEAIESLKAEVDKNISTLMQEIYVFDNIRKYIEVYYEKNSILYENIKKISEEVEARFQEANPNKDFVEYSKINSLKQIISNKINLFATTNVIMQQELIKVNQMIVNHFITINALTMAKNDLLPLVWSELMIDKGLNTEKDATMISGDIMALFQALITQNVESAKENIEKLKQSTLPTEVIDTINKDVDEYILGIEKSKIIEGEIIEPNLEDEGPKLTLNPNNN